MGKEYNLLKRLWKQSVVRFYKKNVKWEAIRGFSLIFWEKLWYKVELGKYEKIKNTRYL